MRIKALAVLTGILLVSMLPVSTSKAAYDVDGTTLTIKAPKGASSMTTSNNEIYLYDANGNTITKQTASGYLIDYAYDAKGNRVSTVEHKFDGLPWGTSVKTYDAAGRVVSEVDATGNPVYTYSYDGNVLTKKETVFPYEAFTYTYDALGRLITREEYGIVYAYTYDAAGNITQVRCDEGFYTLIKDYTYDANGNIATEHSYDTNGGDGVKVYTNAYDALGRLTVVDDGEGNIIQFAY